MGDGVLVYFAYPLAQDDAERAVRAGLKLLAGVGALKTRAPSDARRPRDGPRGRQPPDWLRRGTRAWHRWRDPGPRGALARRCGTEQRSDCGEHPEARG
jgi:hypothetical protein